MGAKEPADKQAKVERALETEARIRAAAEAEQWPRIPGDWWPRSGDLCDLFMVSPSMIHRWLSEGVVMAGGQRMLLHYTVEPGGAREVRPSDVLAVLEERRKLRSADHPGGVETH